jgi:imidazolonepropionase
MNEFILTDIKQIVQARQTAPEVVKGSDMANLPVVNNAWLWVKNGLIENFGEMNNLPMVNCPKIPVSNRMVFPTWCDSHTHIVYAGSREGEFVDKINGLSYEEIAKKGGGILQSAERLRNTSEEVLFEQAIKRVGEVISYGTGAIEIKSGYGLTCNDELKMLRVIRKIKETVNIDVRATFLGAHAIPLEYRSNREGYIQLILKEMLPKVADEGLADYCDVFCDKGFFTPDETNRILEKAAKLGLRAKIHANELDYSGGIQVGVHNDALSVDHLEFTGKDEIESLLASNTMPTLLPSTAFFLRLHYPPAREMIQAGLPIALASDYNPGSSPSGRMQFVLSLACIHLRMTPEEAINAATINSAYAMDLSKSHGSITPGKKANFFVTHEIPSYAFLPYSFGTQLVDRVFLNGLEWSK